MLVIIIESWNAEQIAASSKYIAESVGDGAIQNLVIIHPAVLL
jgi:hypothetical protein